MARLRHKHGQNSYETSSGASPQIDGGGGREESRMKQSSATTAGRRAKTGGRSTVWRGFGGSRPVWMTLRSSHMPDRCHGW